MSSLLSGRFHVRPSLAVTARPDPAFGLAQRGPMNTPGSRPGDVG